MRERVMKWLQIKRYNWKNYDIFLIAVVLILTFISSYVISIVNSDISLKRQLVGVVMGFMYVYSNYIHCYDPYGYGNQIDAIRR